MKTENITVNGQNMVLEYDESLLGKDMSIISGAGTVVAAIKCDDATFTLESNGERGEYWLESVMYTSSGDNEKTEESFSDPIHEIPSTKDEAKETIVDLYQDEINQLIADR